MAVSDIASRYCSVVNKCMNGYAHVFCTVIDKIAIYAIIYTGS